MSSFAGLFDIQPVSSQVSSPPAAYQKPRHDAQVAFELDEYSSPRNGSLSGTQTPLPRDLPSGAQTPITPNELEMSRPPSPKLDEAVSPAQTWNNPPMNKWRLLSVCSIYFGNGINDSAPGALIPYMEKEYNIGYTIVALIFVGNAFGFITAPFFNNILLQKLGRAKCLMLSELIMLAGYVLMIPVPPFPVIVIAFFLIGYGCAINLALNNVFCMNLHPATVILGAAHGSYGIGGLVSPIIATSMVSSGVRWSLFYLFPLGLRVLNIFFAGWAFWSYKEDSHNTLLSALERTASKQYAGEGEISKLQNLLQAVKNRTTLFGALFIFAYQGAEVSISGWVISFLISYRNGDPAHVGYVSAGFWAGITLGRFTLTHAAHYIGERRFVVGLVIGSMAFQLIAWHVPNVIGDAVAVAILGLLLGPIYPSAQTIFSKLMPRHIQMTAVGFIASAGSSGGAVAPFLTGLLSEAVGTYVLHPVCIGLYVVMLGCWFALPRVRKRTE